MPNGKKKEESYKTDFNENTGLGSEHYSRKKTTPKKTVEKRETTKYDSPNQKTMISSPTGYYSFKKKETIGKKTTSVKAQGKVSDYVPKSLKNIAPKSLDKTLVDFSSKKTTTKNTDSKSGVKIKTKADLYSSKGVKTGTYLVKTKK
jgi:hypothetical protein